MSDKIRATLHKCRLLSIRSRNVKMEVHEHVRAANRAVPEAVQILIHCAGGEEDVMLAAQDVDALLAVLADWKRRRELAP